MPPMKIGILQTGHSPDNMKDALGDYGDMFVKLLGGHGFDFQVWSVVDGDFPASAVDADGEDTPPAAARNRHDASSPGNAERTIARPWDS